jgi:CubicO group peptidase (beta-lactamase class C family)
MRPGPRLLALPLALLAVPAIPQALPRPTIELPSAAILPATQALFDAYVKQGRVPGVVGAFGVGDAPTVFVRAGRIGDEGNATPAGPDSLWRIYSMTKPITAMAAMILIEQGKLRLDEPVSDFFPAFRHMTVLTDPDHSLASRPAVREITIRNLLTHTAGLGYSIVTRGPLLDAYNRAGVVPFAASRGTEAQIRPTRPATLAQFAERVATLPLIADPGTRWSYSIGLDLLGAVVEKASGMPFDAFVQARILDPLGMRSTFWQVPASAAGRLATNYLYVGERRLPIDPAASSVFRQPPSFPYGGAGLVSSAADYDRFVHMLQDGGTLGGVRIMRPETVALALSNLLPPGVTYGGASAVTGGTTASIVPMGYGAGGSVTLADTPGGFGKGSYSWGGAAGTIFWIDPVRHFRATVMVNYMPTDTWPLRRDVGRALLQDAKRLP